MRIALGSDERSHLTDFVEQELHRRGFEVELFGPLSKEPAYESDNTWPDIARAVAERVASGGADEGLLFCWTGTGVSMTANKVPGIRAALCWDAETARGARAWNQANVLCMSLRSTSETVAREILDAWFSTAPDPSEEPNVNKLRELDERYRAAAPAAAAASSREGQKGRASGG